MGGVPAVGAGEFVVPAPHFGGGVADGAARRAAVPVRSQGAFFGREGAVAVAGEGDFAGRGAGPRAGRVFDRRAALARAFDFDRARRAGERRFGRVAGVFSAHRQREFARARGVDRVAAIGGGQFVVAAPHLRRGVFDGAARGLAVAVR